MATITDDRLVLLVLVALGVLLVLPVLLMGGGMYGGPMMGGGMWGMGGLDGTMGGWFLVVVSQLLFLAVLVGLGYLVYRALTGGNGADPALEELRSAYARGELSDEEYERRRERLEE